MSKTVKRRGMPPTPGTAGLSNMIIMAGAVASIIALVLAVVSVV